MTSLTKRQKRNVPRFLFSLFFLALSAYAYFNLYSPAKEEKEQMK